MTSTANHKSSTAQHLHPLKICKCRNPVECKGLTAGFAVLDDPRCGFLRIPSHDTDDLERNQRRAAYLQSMEFSSQNPKFLAMHHFSPKVVAVVSNFQQGQRQPAFPKTLPKEELQQLGLLNKENSRVVFDQNGKPTDRYIVLPTYSLEQAKQDLKRLLQICKQVNINDDSDDEIQQKSQRKKDPSKLLLQGSKNAPRPNLTKTFVCSDDSNEEEENYLPTHLVKNISLSFQDDPNQQSQKEQVGYEV